MQLFQNKSKLFSVASPSRFEKNSILPIIEKNNNAEMLFFECGNVVVVVVVTVTE